MKIFLRHKKNNNTRGQSTTELAIMGTIVIITLAYLLQQGYIYNSRQALEMYGFREALKLSRAHERGVNLTVSRDVITPSFFSGLNRQRLMASSSVEVNPWKVYLPKEEDPEDIGSYQLMQIGEAMIRHDQFVQVPPTLVEMDSDDGSEWQWSSSAIQEIDPQTLPEDPTQIAKAVNISDYSYVTSMAEDASGKTITKNLQTQDAIARGLTFKDRDTTISDYNKNDPEYKMVDLNAGTIPSDINFTLSETVERKKETSTPHN